MNTTEADTRLAGTSGTPDGLSSAGLAAHIPEPANRLPAPCPTCSGQTREADGTWTIRQPILAYVGYVLDAVVENAYSDQQTRQILRQLALEVNRTEKARAER